MRNEKGFTLMELMAAIFIGGMVTAALILIWKTASIQTSQGQRQTIIRNQISSFQRQLYKDFYSSDIIVSPNFGCCDISTNTPSILLSGIKKAKRIDALHYEPFAQTGNVLEGPTKVYLYCYKKEEQTIHRYEQTIGLDTDNPQPSLYINDDPDHGFTENFLEPCLRGTVVLRNFDLDSVERTDAGKYSLQGRVVRTFADLANTTPIVVSVNETLLETGGI